MALLGIVQEACRRLALPVPTAVATSTDKQFLQMMGMCNEEGQELADRYQWQILQAEATFTTVATESQGAISTIAPGFKYVINSTMWNRSITTPVRGSQTPQYWQQLKSSNITGPYAEYRIVGDTLKFIPAPFAGQTVAFEYMSANWVNVTGGNTGPAFTNDADTSMLDEQLITLGLIWRFKQAKGFDYAEDFRKYERRVTDAMGRDGSKPTLNSEGLHNWRMPNIPEGNWPT